MSYVKLQRTHKKVCTPQISTLDFDFLHVCILLNRIWYLFLFCYGLFNAAVSSDYMALSCGKIMYNELEKK
jgi:hypothetical protein